MFSSSERTRCQGLPKSEQGDRFRKGSFSGKSPAKRTRLRATLRITGRFASPPVQRGEASEEVGEGHASGS